MSGKNDAPRVGSGSPECPEQPAHSESWRSRPVLVAASFALASGFAQFSVFAALGDVAAAFGQTGNGASVAARVGLSGAALGGGLAVVRLSGLGSLLLSTLADTAGRRRVLLGTCGTGLAITALAGLSPAYWVFIALVALARPLLSSTNNICGVIAGEETAAPDRAKAVALISACYGFGAAVTQLVRTAAGHALGFRGLFALVTVPLVIVLISGRWVREPERFVALPTTVRQRFRPAAVPPAYRRRLLIMGALAFAIAFLTGPFNGLLVVYAERILGLSRGEVAAVTVGAGPMGVAGLLLGRWAADRFGRRPTAAAMQTLAAFAFLGAYSLPATGLAVASYLASALLGSAYGPAFGALALEAFPTSARATSAGWMTVAGVLGAAGGLVVFGLAADRAGFGPAAALVSVPVICSGLLFLGLPETAGLELEESAPDRA